MATTAPPPLLGLCLLLLFIALATHQVEPRLTADYYSRTCPQVERIVQQIVIDKQISSPTTAAGLIRLLFHDCIVTGCDASLLVTSTPLHSHTAERDAEPNLSLPGDAFDLVVRVKTAVELSCPGVVSCSDIISLAARDLLVMLGGPYYPVVFGRKDSHASTASSVRPDSIPKPNMRMDVIIQIFESKGFTIREMVALSGAHSVGLSHCNQFATGIYNYSRSQLSDPAYDRRFAASLRTACKDYRRDPTTSVFNDIMTPNKFDNVYFKNLESGLGLLASDRALVADRRTKGFVAEFARDEKSFFRAFAAAMQKMSLVGVKVGRDGEVRRRCDAFNN